MNEEKIEEMLREIGILMSWQTIGHFLLRAGWVEAYWEVAKVAVSFLKSYGSKQDLEPVRKIRPLVEAEFAKWKEEEKKGVSVSPQANEATKRWVGEMLKDMGRKLAESE